MFKINGIPLIPVEAVIAVLEVKSQANSRRVLQDCYDVLASCKKLDKSTAGRNNELIDRWWAPDPPDWDDFTLQVFGAVLAVESVSRDLWMKATAEWCNGKPLRLWPHFFCGVGDYGGTYHMGVAGRNVASPNPARLTS